MSAAYRRTGLPDAPADNTSGWLFRELAENANDVVYAHDLDGRLIWVNRAAEALTGRPREELIGRRIDDLVAPEHQELVRAMSARKVAGQAEATTYQLEIVAADGRRVALEVSTRLLLRDGHPVGVQGVARDVTARQRADRHQRFLVAASQILASSIDYATTLSSIARLAIPDLADWCAVDLVGPDGEVRPVARAHVDPAREPDLHEIYRRYAPTTRGGRPVAVVLRTGRPVFLPDAESSRVESSVDAEHAELRRAIGFGSLMVVPLLTGGRTLGTMVFARGPGRAPYQPDDLPVAEELGRRAATAIDNARIYRDAQEQATAHAELSRALRETADALRESEARYRRLVEGAPDAIAVHRGGRILYANPAAAGLVGAPDAAALVGRSILDLVHPDDRATALEQAGRVAPPGSAAERTAARFVRLDGRTIDVEVASLPIVFEGEPAAQVVVRDVTALKRAAERSARLQAVATELAGALTPVEVARVVAEQAARALDARAGALVRLSDDGQWFEVLHQSGYAVGTPEAERVMRQYRRFPAGLSTPVADAVRDRAMVVLPSAAARAERYPHLAEVGAATGPGAAVVVPLLLDGRPLGALHVTFAEARDLPEDERSFLETLAAQCTIALERARLFEVERGARAGAEAARRRMALLAEASRLFANAGANAQAVLDALLERVCAVVGDAAAIRLVRADGRTLDLAAAYHPDPDALAMLRSPPLSDPIPIGAGASGQAVATAQPVLAPTVDPGVAPAGALPIYAEYLRRFPIGGAATLPMRARDRVVGALSISRSAADRPYAADELALVQDLADRAALAIDNAQLAAAAGRVAARTERLQTITSQLGRSLTPETVLQQVTDSAALLLDAPVAAVFLLGGPDDDFTLAAAHGVEASRAGELRLPRHTSLAGRAVDEGRTVIVNDVREDPGTALPALLTGEVAGAEVAAPIVGGAGTLGVIKVFSPTARAFTDEDGRLLEALAAAAAVAITNARLFADAQESLRARDAFLSIAAHELKTPTTAVLAGAQLLLRRSQRGRLVLESVDRHADVIVEAAKRLSRLVDDLLDVSRVRTGQLALRLATVDLGEVARRVVARDRERLEGHGPALDLAEGCLVSADADRIEQVLENLLDNAVKYSRPGGRIAVGVAARRDAVRLSVRDEGIGLPPGAAERIFQPFERAPNAAERQLPGMGLGLHICRNIVELHGGRIWAVSPGENAGTTFHVELPRVGTGDASP